MAEQTLQADSACANPATVLSRYSAWRYAKAAWDIALYSPDRGDEDLPDEINLPLMNAECEAFDRLMRTPAQTTGDLIRKLEVFRDEGGHQLTNAALYVAILALDARHVHLTH